MVSRFHDIGAYIKSANAFAAYTVSSAAGGSEVTGPAIDRLNDTERFLSCKVCIGIHSSFTSTQTATVTSNVQHSSVTTSSAFTDYARKDSTAAFVATIGSAASTAAQDVHGVCEYDVDLGAAKRYIRVQVTTAIPAAGATAQVGGVVVLGGGDFLPPQ